MSSIAPKGSGTDWSGSSRSGRGRQGLRSRGSSEISSTELSAREEMFRMADYLWLSGGGLPPTAEARTRCGFGSTASGRSGAP
jgi:hypothetical protein